MVSRTKHGTVNMRSNNATELSTCISQTNADTGSNCAFESSDTFRPDDWVG
jgi:hypothetical protein